MGIAYLVITILLAAIVTFSGIGKIRRDPRIVQVIHELIGVPSSAACEINACGKGACPEGPVML